MAASSLPLMLFLLVLTTTTITATTARRPSSKEAMDFIRSSCKRTLYPSLCEGSLSSHASSIGKSPRALALAALSVSLSRSRDASKFVSHLTSSSHAVTSRKIGAIRDCIETMRDGVDRLRRSVKEMNNVGHTGTESFHFHLSNVQTWVSAALTDENTCLDGVRHADAIDHATRAAIRKEIVRVAQVTSNALAFVNAISYT